MQQADGFFEVGNNQTVIHLLRRGLLDGQRFFGSHGVVHHRHIAEITNQIQIGVRTQKMRFSLEYRLGIHSAFVVSELYRVYLLQEDVGAVADLVQVEPERIHIRQRER